jgi:hypothetical protein
MTIPLSTCVGFEAMGAVVALQWWMKRLEIEERNFGNIYDR